MTDEPDLTKRHEQVLRAFTAQKRAAGEDIAAALVGCGSGSRGIGGVAKGLILRSSKRGSA